MFIENLFLLLCAYMAFGLLILFIIGLGVMLGYLKPEDLV